VEGPLSHLKPSGVHFQRPRHWKPSGYRAYSEDVVYDRSRGRDVRARGPQAVDPDSLPRRPASRPAPQPIVSGTNLAQHSSIPPFRVIFARRFFDMLFHCVPSSSVVDYTPFCCAGPSSLPYGSGYGGEYGGEAPFTQAGPGSQPSSEYSAFRYSAAGALCEWFSFSREKVFHPFHGGGQILLSMHSRMRSIALDTIIPETRSRSLYVSLRACP
jgi:hypothetical protein